MKDMSVQAVAAASQQDSSVQKPPEDVAPPQEDAEVIPTLADYAEEESKSLAEMIKDAQEKAEANRNNLKVKNNTRYGDAPLEAYARLARAKNVSEVNAAAGYARRRMAQLKGALHVDSDNAAKIKAAISQLQKVVNRGAKKKRDLTREQQEAKRKAQSEEEEQRKQLELRRRQAQRTIREAGYLREAHISDQLATRHPDGTAPAGTVHGRSADRFLPGRRRTAVCGGGRRRSSPGANGSNLRSGITEYGSKAPAGQPGRSFFSRPQQYRLELTALQGRLNRAADEGEIRHQGTGLFFRIVLPEGDEIVILPHQQFPQIPGRTAQTVVGRHGDYHWPVVAQMGLRRHGHGGVGDAVGQLAQGVACAGRDDQYIQQLLRPDWLRIPDAADGRMSCQTLQRGQKRLRRSKPCVRGPAGPRHDGQNALILPAQLFQLRQYPGVGAERAAYRKSHSFFSQMGSPRSSNM